MARIVGVDTALWDLQGKRADRPVCELIGGSVRPLAVYASSMRRDIEPAEEAARLAGLQDRHGYRAVKFRIGRECGNVPALVGGYLAGNLLLDELITRRIGLEELNDAFDALRAGEGARSVLVLE